ncbi:hypothetical protein L7F22_027378 [Adiantum nelumboides]|nr:hypothetical protein [Adiantum nelumboides]
MHAYIYISRPSSARPWGLDAYCFLRLVKSLSKRQLKRRSASMYHNACRSGGGSSEETPMLVNYFITRLQQAMANPALQGEVQQQLQAYGFIPPHQEERIPEKSLGETSKRGTSKDHQSSILKPTITRCWCVLKSLLAESCSIFNDEVGCSVYFFVLA